MTGEKIIHKGNEEDYKKIRTNLDNLLDGKLPDNGKLPDELEDNESVLGDTIPPETIEYINRKLKEKCIPLKNKPIEVKAMLNRFNDYLKEREIKVGVSTLEKQLKKLVQEEKEKSQVDFNELLKTNPGLFEKIIKELKEKILPVIEPLQQDNLIEKLSENTGLKLSSLRTQLKKLKQEERQKELNTIEEKKKEQDEKNKISKEIFAKAKEKEIEKLTKDKTLIELPRADLIISEFAKNLGQVYTKSNILFYKGDTKQVVYLNTIKTPGVKNEYEFLGFSEMTPSKFITYIEKDILTWENKLIKEKDGSAFYKKCFQSITPTLAKTVLDSPQFQEQLPFIKRIFSVPIPIIYDGQLTFPKKGYDERFFSWLDKNAPEITEVEIEKAKEYILDIYKEFCFKDKQDKVHAIAGLLTPFLRGLYPAFNTRTPLFFYLANRERVGKDYCAGITGIVYEGAVNEDPPISDSEKNLNNKSDEFKKKILALMIEGKKRFHSSNNKGNIDNSAFESVLTSTTFRDRLLGRNETVTIDNEMDFSMSANLGATFTADLENRSRFINFVLAIEDPNKRKFEREDLQGYVLENRAKILSCLYALVKKWVENGSPKGKTAFTSFPTWAKICGGILVYNELGDPCESQKGFGLAGNIQDGDMKKLFELGYNHFQNNPFTKKELMEEIQKNWQGVNDIFISYNFNENSERAKFSKIFLKYVDRIFSDILLEAIQGVGDISAGYRTFKFTHTGG